LGRPAVSVVMAAHNARDFLEEAARSILAQTFGDLELILVLDGPTDGTESVARAIAVTSSRVRLMEYWPNRGLPHALNRGVREARAAYVARQDADDISEPDRLARQLEAVRTRSLDLAGTNFSWIDVQGRPLGANASFPESVDAAVRQGSFLFPHGSALFAREAFLRAGGYDERFFFTQDLELWSRMARSGGQVGFLAKPLYRLRLGPASRLKSCYQRRYSELVARAHFQGEDIGGEAAALLKALSRERAQLRELDADLRRRYCFRAANLAARNGQVLAALGYLRQAWHDPGPWTERLWRTALAAGLLLAPSATAPDPDAVILLGGKAHGCVRTCAATSTGK